MKSSEFRKLNNPLAGCEIIIGIDPGKNTGFALYQLGSMPMVNLETYTFWSCLDRITDCASAFAGRVEKIGIVIEIPRMLMYGRNRGAAEKAGVANTMSSKMGGNRREGELMAERLESLGFPVVRKTPSQTKWNAAECKRITGIDLKTNEHTRDAIRLAWEHI